MNIRSFVLGAQRAVDLMSDGGRIVTLSSYGSIRAYPTYANLGAAKAALEAYVRYMAVEFAPLGVNVNAVNGGIIESDSSAYFYDVEGMPDLNEQVLPKIPKARQGSVKEVANCVEFLLELGSTTDAVDCLMARGLDNPGTRELWNARNAPLIYCGGKCFLSLGASLLDLLSGPFPFF